MYCLKSRVRYSECDEKAQITLPALVNYLQDCCTFQSEDLNIGVDYLKENHVAWVLSSWQVIIKRYPKMGETITISTWPYDFKGFYGYRNFKIEDEAGNVISYANSIWVYLDTQKNRPMRIPKEIQKIYAFEPAYPMELTDRKMEIPEKMQEMTPFPVQKFQIDTNNHVNNEKYILMALEYLPAKVTIDSVRVEYKKAAVLGDIIYPYVAIEQDKQTITLCDEEGKPYAVVEFLHHSVKGD